MKLPLSWLAEFVRLNAAQLRGLDEALPKIGIEVAGRETVDGEDVIEVEITANRGDLLSVYGMAREIGAMIGRPVKPRGAAKRKNGVAPLKKFVRIEGGGCRRYLGARIEGVKIGSAPEWMARRLRAAGFASFNAVVDITNFVLAELGQPLHAFDADLLRGTVQVRAASPVETINALDGKRYKLEGDMVIADSERAVALAGVIGGSETAVSNSTKNIFLECAWFEPSAVRQTSRRTGVATESSYRFERNVNPDGMESAFFRAIQLIEELTGGKLTGTADEGRRHGPRKAIPLSMEAIERTIGMRLPASRISGSLKNLGCQIRVSGKDRWAVTPPVFRPDLAIAEDLIEEAARLYGADKIPSRLPVTRPVKPVSEERKTVARLRRTALSMGLTETLQMSFVDPENLKKMGLNPDEAVRLANPLSSAVSHLRPSLIPGILSVASLNLRRGAAAVHVFEIGPAFLNSQQAPIEDQRLAIVTHGMVEPIHFSRASRAADFFDVKSCVETLLQASGRVNGPAQFVPAVISGFDPAVSAAVMIGKSAVGCVGKISGAAAAAMDVPPDTYAAEITLSRLMRIAPGDLRHSPVPRFPAIRRDLSLIVKDAVKADDLRRTIASAQIPSLAEFGIFDLYRGKGIPPGTYAVGLSFVFQSPERTLSDEEANAARDTILSRLTADHEAALRT